MRLAGEAQPRLWITFAKIRATNAEDNLTKAQGILDLYDAVKEQVISLTRSQHAIPALDWLFTRPIFKSTEFVKQVDIPAPTARRILKCLRNSNICTTMRAARWRRAALLAFPQLLAITEDNPAP